MKKVLFVSAIMLMALTAFVACKKNGYNPGDITVSCSPASGQPGVCACYAFGQLLGNYDMEGYLSCSDLAEIVNNELGY